MLLIHAEYLLSMIIIAYKDLGRLGNIYRYFEFMASYRYCSHQYYVVEFSTSGIS